MRHLMHVEESQHPLETGLFDKVYNISKINPKRIITKNKFEGIL
jgi:hypothetical protein